MASTVLFSVFFMTNEGVSQDIINAILYSEIMDSHQLCLRVSINTIVSLEIKSRVCQNWQVFKFCELPDMSTMIIRALA